MNHYTLRAGIALQDEHAGVLIDSVGNYIAKTQDDPRSLALLLRMIADQIESDVTEVGPYVASKYADLADRSN